MDTAVSRTFSKNERLCGKTSVSALLSHGKWGTTAHLKYCVWKKEDSAEGIGGSRVLVSVPKRFFKRAVKRNLLKRRIREAYRLNKYLLSGTEAVYDIMFQYNSDEIATFDVVDSEVRSVLSAL